jgi:hypothetical protein
MEEQQELFGKLFESIPLHTEEHLDILLDTMDNDRANYFLIQAVKYAFHSGIYSLGEAEVISKSIRVLSKKNVEKVVEE